jgi:hypothetical protein
MDTLAHTRSTDPRTSHRAAHKVRPRAPTIRAQVLAFARNRMDFIDEDLVEAFPGSPESSYRKRRSELTEGNWIVDTGRTRRNGDGNDMVVWQHRDRHPSPPPLKARETKVRPKEDRARALAHATNLDSFADAMRKEGRSMMADELRECAAMMRRLA